MESRIRSSPEWQRLVFIQNVILDVAHFVMSGDEILMIHTCALFDAEVFSIAKILSQSIKNKQK